MQDINFITIFLTGLFTGGLTCMAVQGGLLAATLAQREQNRLKEKTRKTGNAIPILIFIGAKLIAYTAFGFLLGSIGAYFTLSLSTQFLIQMAVAFFMIGTALNILNVHPIFRYFALQPPRFLTRFIRQQSKSDDFFAPALLGALTVFIPCGTTQAMMALAIASGNSFVGAAVLFAFVLGTSPLFFALGYFTTKLSASMHGLFMKFAAVAIIILALFNLNNALSLAGAGISLPTITSAKSDVNITSEKAVTEASVYIGPLGYTPTTITFKKNSLVTLNLINKDSYTCAAAFTIPSLGIQRVVNVGTTEKISFTTPKDATEIPFMCSMGMYRGVIKVI